MCQPVSRQSRFSLIFFVQQEPEPEPRARIRFRFFLGQNDTVAAPVPQHWAAEGRQNIGGRGRVPAWDRSPAEQSYGSESIFFESSKLLEVSVFM